MPSASTSNDKYGSHDLSSVFITADIVEVPIACLDYVECESERERTHGEYDCNYTLIIVISHGFPLRKSGTQGLK